MLRRTIGVLLAVLLLAVASANAQTDDMNMPVLASGETVEDALTENIAAKLFAFNASQGDIVAVQMTAAPESTFAPCLVVLGPAGQSLAADCTDAGADAAQVVVDVPFEGSHFVLATSFEAVDGRLQVLDAPEPFTLTLEGNTPPPGIDDTLVYFRSDLTFGTSTEGYSSPGEPVYYFVFDGASANAANIVMTSDDIDAMLLVFDNQGNRVAINDDAEGLQLPNNTDAAVQNLPLPDNESYLVFATDVSFYEIPNQPQDAQFRGGNFVITAEPAS